MTVMGVTEALHLAPLAVVVGFLLEPYLSSLLRSFAERGL